MPSPIPLTYLAVRSEGVREEFNTSEFTRRLFTC
jgi:hypothetical protein